MAIPKNKNFSDYDNYLNDSNPTTAAQAQDFFKIQAELLKAVVDSGCWQPETNYTVGDVVYSPSFSKSAEAVCVKAGKSSTSEPSWGALGGANVIDGTAVWQLRLKQWREEVATQEEAEAGEDNAKMMTPKRVKDAFDAFFPLAMELLKTGVGTVIASAANEDLEGYLLCNGAAVSRTTYRELFEKIGTLYGTGDGSTTFNLPNLTNKFIQGSGTSGAVKEAGLPNITGTGARFNYELWTPTNTADHNDGAILKGPSYGETKQTGSNEDNRAASYGWNFDASLSNAIYGNSDTVQPPAVTMRYYIKY